MCPLSDEFAVWIRLDMTVTHTFVMVTSWANTLKKNIFFKPSNAEPPISNCSYVNEVYLKITILRGCKENLKHEGLCKC